MVLYLLVLSTALFNKPPTRNILCSGLILASDGKKMSKKDNNFVKPQELLNIYSADSIRLYLIGSPAAKADSFKFNSDHITVIMRKLDQLCNCYTFFEENLKKFTNIHKLKESTNYNNIPNKWIIARLAKLALSIDKNISCYDINKIPEELLDFIEDFTNLYLKFNRCIIKGNCSIDETNNALNITAFVIISFCKIAAPFVPFISEYLYQKIAATNIFSTKRISSFGNLSSDQ